MEEGGQVIIYCPDKGVVWTLIPEEKSYMQIPLSVFKRNKGNVEVDINSGEIAEKKYLGRETINGYTCDKYTIRF